MLVHILKGPYSEWFARPRDAADTMLCGMTANYYEATKPYWEIATGLHEDGDWRDDEAPTCDACLLLHLADPSQALVLA